MLDGRPLIDAHQHPVRLSTVKPAWLDWAERFGQPGWRAAYTAGGEIIPRAFDELMRDEGVDHALVICEYSPKATGMQPAEDLLPLPGHNPARFSLVANINPHLHYPVDEELERQLGLGAVALKIHPVHAGAAVNDRALYPAYEICQSAGLPVVVHCGTSTFPGSSKALADPALVNEHVWIELSGLPPSRLREYYARHSWPRLTRKMIFGTDWPGVPGIARNARAVAALCPDEFTAALVLAGNAAQVYNLKLPA